jgi:hypothetical protein
MKEVGVIAYNAVDFRRYIREKFPFAQVSDLHPRLCFQGSIPGNNLVKFHGITTIEHARGRRLDNVLITRSGREHRRFNDLLMFTKICIPYKSKVKINEVSNLLRLELLE